jgi:hypothetical protein
MGAGASVAWLDFRKSKMPASAGVAAIGLRATSVRSRQAEGS